jgi:hypothetical protein
MEGTALFSYQIRCIDTDTHYSDNPIPCEGRKKLLPFGSRKDRTYSFDFDNKSDKEIHVDLDVKLLPGRPSDKKFSFREYTLGGLYVRSPLDIEAGEEFEVPLINFRGGHYEIHEIYSPLYKEITCKIKHGDRIIDEFHIEHVYRFKKEWILRWPDSLTLSLRNEGGSKLEIQPTEIYFAGYLLKPTRVIRAVAPVNARNTFLIEGIRL